MSEIKSKSNRKLIILIKKLPEELKIKIYKEYFEVEYYNKIILQALDTNNSISLQINDIRPLIPIILSKKNLITYLNINNSIFKELYNSHKFNNKKNFVLCKKGDSFALSWLFYLYH